MQIFVTYHDIWSLFMIFYDKIFNIQFLVTLYDFMTELEVYGSLMGNQASTFHCFLQKEQRRPLGIFTELDGKNYVTLLTKKATY